MTFWALENNIELDYNIELQWYQFKVRNLAWGQTGRGMTFWALKNYLNIFRYI